MITIASLFVFISFYTLYYTSKRAVLSYDFSFEKWMQRNPKQTKITGLCLLLLAYLLWLLSASLGSATLFFFIQLMTISSLVIILTPLKVINFKGVIILFALSGLLEFYYY
ncbi:hypothetical protein OIU80_15790 [Flavobacterium sp. LS1R47]|uniref:DUF3325 domain-containing protein n=1 Tax=Flavobacterium frigoritolerans TaxID=2987686 RepID=A0A9X2ZMH8_9FLAO|nr:hypothetical protein [Flavobacterium frigoritolerans]MCV9933744.1 hypothetical protein [Flavobacterium frigoritolerans]